MIRSTGSTVGFFLLLKATPPIPIHIYKASPREFMKTFIAIFIVNLNIFTLITCIHTAVYKSLKTPSTVYPAEHQSHYLYIYYTTFTLKLFHICLSWCNIIPVKYSFGFLSFKTHYFYIMALKCVVFVDLPCDSLPIQSLVM